MALAHVRTGSGSGSATAASFTLAAAPAQGNLLVAMVSAGAGPSVGSGWNGLTSVVNTDVGVMFWKVCGAGESATQSPATWGSAVPYVVAACEYSGNDPAPLDVQTATLVSTAAKVTASVKPTDTISALVVGAINSDGARTYSAQQFNGSATGVTPRVSPSAGATTTGESCTLFDAFVNTATSTFTAGATASAADGGGAYIAIFKPAAATPSSPPFQRRWRYLSARRVA